MQYADDSELLSPSPKGVQKHKNICEEFAIENDMIFNVNKTFCMLKKSKACVKIKIANVFVNGNVLKWITEHKYVGAIIADDFKS